jgi:hypothetical protein
MKKSLRFILGNMMVCVLGFTASAHAQTTETSADAGKQVRYAQNIYGIGLYASLSSGMGISFKQHLANVPIAYQLTAGAIKFSGATLWDFGFEFQYDLATDVNRLYAIVSAGAYHRASDHVETKDPARFGLGIGYEIAQSRAIGVSFALIITDFQPSGDILPLPSIGLHYYFK